jgi:hypothetical protein
LTKDITYKLFLCCFWFIIGITSLSGQDIYQRYNIYRPPFRVFINHICWNLSTGYGYTQYNHNLEGFWLYQDQGSLFIRQQLPDESNIPPFIQGYGNWLNAPDLGPEVETEIDTDIPWRYLQNPINNPALSGAPYANGDTVFWQGNANSIPITASLNVEFKNFKVGGGYTFEPQWVGEFKTVNKESGIPNYQPNFSYTAFHRAFGFIGYRFYEYWDYAAVVDLQVGKLWYGKVFTPGIYRGTININAGLTLEHHWSEYFALTLRPSFDYKRYTLNLPDGSFLLHRHNSFHMQMGVSIKIPEIPRSPNQADHVQLKHVITDPQTGRLMEVRGQPFWKKQNPKVGENHRKLWRYKWRNKRKLNPY